MSQICVHLFYGTVYGRLVRRNPSEILTKFDRVGDIIIFELHKLLIQSFDLQLFGWGSVFSPCFGLSGEGSI